MAEQNVVVIGWNPGAGSASRALQIESLEASLHQHGFCARPTTSIKAAIELAIDCHQRGTLRSFVAAGGDGTIRTMAEQLPIGAPIAIYPMGTENLLAKFLGLTSDPRKVVAAVKNGTDFWIDAGFANGRMFLVMVTCGFDADVVGRVHKARHGHIRHSTWLAPVWSAMRQYRFPALRISADHMPSSLESRWAFIFNVPRYAMNLKIAPDADPTDGLLDVWSFRQGGILQGLLYLGAVLLGRHQRQTSVLRFQSSAVTIEADETVPFQIDGDPGGELPVTITIVPRRVRLRVPASNDQTRQGWRDGKYERGNDD